MALLRNGSYLRLTPAKFVGGSIHNNLAFMTDVSVRKSGFVGGFDKTSAQPVGYLPPHCWLLPMKAGGMGATGDKVGGTGRITSFNLAGGLNAESTLAGSGGIDSASMGLIMQAVATLAGTSSLSAAANGILDAIATLTGSSSLSAPLGAIAGGLATLAGTGGICCSSATAKAFMSADIAPATTVAAEVIGRAVLDAVIENGLSLADIQRVLLAVAAGDATGLDTDPVFMSQDGTKERITGTLSGGTRTVTGIDPT